jgi:hypothetical protein
LIFLANGPPKSGKDFLIPWFKDFGYEHLSFKKHLFNYVADHYSISLDLFLENYDEQKDVSETFLNGKTRREALIYVSETYIKKTYGPFFFGEQTAMEIDINKNYYVSDLGFLEEIQPIINKVGIHNIICIQMTRQGCSFELDSRRYLEAKLKSEFILGFRTHIHEEYVLKNTLNLNAYRVHNNSTKSDLYSAIEYILKHDQGFK